MGAWRKTTWVAMLLAGLLFSSLAFRPLTAEDGAEGEAAAADVTIATPAPADPSTTGKTAPSKPISVPAPATGSELGGPAAPKTGGISGKQSEPIVIVYKNFPYTGWYVGSDSEHFSYRLQGGDGAKETLLTFTWAGASPAERKVIYRQFGIDAVDDTPVYGSKVEAERVTLKNGMIYYGFTTEIINETNKKMMQFTGAQVKRLMLEPSEIDKIEKVKVYESQVYSNQEIYTRHKYEGAGMQTAADHFKMANFCTKLYLPDEGLEHLEAAGELDARFLPGSDAAIQTLQDELKEMSHRKAGDELVRQIELNNNAHEYGVAMSLIDRYMKIFPDHHSNTYVTGLKSIIEKMATQSDSASVIQTIYSEMDDLVREKIATKAVQGVVLPGKRVVGVNGQVWDGELKEETDKEIVLVIKNDAGDTKTLRIHKNNVKQSMDIDLNKNNGDKKFIAYQEARQWVDSDRFSKDLFERVGKKLKLTPAKVKEYWDARTGGEYVMDDKGNFIPPKDYTRLLSIDVGGGTFLLYKGGNNNNRGGNRNNAQSLTPAQQAALRQNDSGWSRNGNTVNGTVNGGTTAKQTGPDPKDIQPLNENDWWEQAQVSSRVNAVMGMIALKFLEPKSTTMYTCPVCGGNGYLAATMDASGKTAYKCCPNCNGNMQLVRLVAK
ncbi:MAG TPA: hypothetical protein VL860_04405 [Planctomycetota bacterium]|nr:hypothetical protein [Planctomycetota bacterium]